MSLRTSVFVGIVGLSAGFILGIFSVIRSFEMLVEEEDEEEIENLLSSQEKTVGVSVRPEFFDPNEAEPVEGAL